MLKIMLFIDGTWLYSNTPKLAEACGKNDFQVDFGRLPKVLAEEVSQQLGEVETHVVRTYLFGSYAANYDLRDDDAVQRRLDFFSMLKEEYHYELETFPVNFKGRRLRRLDRDPRDPFEPKEKCVDIALATAMLYYAAIPYVYDIAIAVIGDQDFKPVLQHVRRLGKRVAIVSIQGSCAPDFADPRDESRVKDFDIIWLEHLLHRLELKYERHQLECQSPIHDGERRVWTTFYPRKGQKFFCDACRAEFANQRQVAQQEFVTAATEPSSAYDTNSLGKVGLIFSGVVKKKMTERGFGFIHAENDDCDYFFHFADLRAGSDFNEIEEGASVEFQVKQEPSTGKAGAAQDVRKLTIKD
ncbi:MAG: cold shock domain-containing protein [Candidatus Binatia bacterium]